MKRLYYFILLSVLLCGCAKEIPVGFMSPNGIRMREDTMNVVSGIYYISDVPRVDGSTRPLHFEILDIKDVKTGQKAEIFLQKQQLRLWKEAFNPDTDTTLALVKTKLLYLDTVPLLMNSVSGQIAFTAATGNIASGVYTIDAKVSSQAGERYLKNFGIVKLSRKPWEVPNNFGEYLHGTILGGSDKEVIEARNPIPATEMEQVKSNTHPRYSIEKIAEGEDVKVRLIFMDANGEAFDGKAIANWPDGADYLNNWFDNSVETKFLSDGVELNFPTTPFPDFGRRYKGDRASIVLSYYTLHPNYYTLTPDAVAKIKKFENDNNKKFIYTNLRVKITYQINEPGTWVVKVKFAYALKKK